MSGRGTRARGRCRGDLGRGRRGSCARGRTRWSGAPRRGCQEGCRRVICRYGGGSGCAPRRRRQSLRGHILLRLEKECESLAGVVDWKDLLVLTSIVHPWHFGGFAANEGTPCLFASISYTTDDSARHGNIKFAASVVIQEIQRFGALHNQVVYRHRHEIDAC